MFFWYLQCFQKTNEKIRPNYYGTSCSVFFGKRHFEINWPLHREFDKSQLSFKMLFVFIVLQKWSTPPKPPAPAPAPVFSGLLNIVAPVVAGLLVLGIGCLMCLVIMVRKKRSLHGTYNPQKQEINAPRFELTEMDVFKKPAEERLIWVSISVSVTQNQFSLSNSFC